MTLEIALGQRTAIYARNIGDGERSGRRYSSNLPFINHSGAISRRMDTDAPTAPLPVLRHTHAVKAIGSQFRRTFRVADLRLQRVPSNSSVPPEAEVFVMAGH